MQVLFTSRDAQAEPLRELTIERVRFAMRRVTPLVPRATVQLSDVNGPRGGIDKRCQLQLKTDGAGTVVITSTAHDWRAALETALDRANRVLLRQWRRAHSQRAPSRRTLTQDS
jgi:ribosome-associated translation inhibitor RaiA